MFRSFRSNFKNLRPNGKHCVLLLRKGNEIVYTYETQKHGKTGYENNNIMKIQQTVLFIILSNKMLA